MQETKDSQRSLIDTGKRPLIKDSSDEDVFNNIRKILSHSDEKLENPYEQIPEIPNIKLTVQEMNSDPIELLMKLQKQYKDFGAVRLTASECWNCPFTFRYVDKGITTRIQCLQKLKQGKPFEQNIEAYSIKSYETFARQFEKKYSFKSEVPGTTLESKKQFQYWKLVTDEKYCKNQVKVQYAADLSTLKYGSGFPTRPMPNWKDTDFVYENNLFNLNNILRSPTSILAMSEKRKEKVSGITHPWVYMGMLFSTFCWHVEDLWVNSLNYNHKGSIKTWYIIPGIYKEKFDEYVRSTYCTNTLKKNLLEKITFMIDPLELIQNGIPVYKTYQRPRDYICTFFKAYHCGFSQGYNIGEAVNFMSPLSIDLMVQAKEEKQKYMSRNIAVIPIDWVIYENYEQRKSMPDYIEIIEKNYFNMIKDEQEQIKKVVQRFKIEQIQIFSSKFKYDKYYCCICKDYLYLRAYKSSLNSKNYCYTHLIEKVQAEVPINLLLREVNENRKNLQSLVKK